MDHGTTSQDTARPRTRRHPTQALVAAYGARVCHLDQTVYSLPRHTPSQGDGKRRHRGLSDASRGPAEGRRLHPQPGPQCLTIPLPRRAQTSAPRAHRRNPCAKAQTPADGADHGGSPEGDGIPPRIRCVNGHLTRRHSRAMNGMSAVRRDRPRFRATAERRPRWQRHGGSGDDAA
jgi:hypothetical protein